MAYNRKNLLKRIIDVQNLYQKHKLEGVTHVHVYRTYIYPAYKISMRTLDQYLQVPAVAELKKIEAKEEEDRKNNGTQGTLDLNDE